MTRSSELDSWLDEWSQHIADWETYALHRVLNW